MPSTVTLTSSPTISDSFSRLVKISIAPTPCLGQTSSQIGWGYYAECDAASLYHLAPDYYPSRSNTRFRTGPWGGILQLPVQPFDVRFQLPDCIAAEGVELYTNVKYVLCKAFRVNNPGAGLDIGNTFFVQGQLELDVNPDIHNQTDGFLAIGYDAVDDFMRTAELQPADRDIEYLRSGQGATRQPNFTGQFSTDTKMSSVAAKVLLIVCVRVHVSCTRLSGIPCGLGERRIMPVN
jgi:hypothetical protein